MGVGSHFASHGVDGVTEVHAPRHYGGQFACALSNSSLTHQENERDMNADIKAFNEKRESSDREICELLSTEIDKRLPEAQSKIWHRHPVWFLEDNPTVGFSKLKAGIRLMFWSGADFREDRLKPGILNGKYGVQKSLLFQREVEIIVRRKRLFHLFGRRSSQLLRENVGTSRPEFTPAPRIDTRSAR
jgi:hypothetical protein